MLMYLRLLWFRMRSRFQRDALDEELAEELRVHAEFLEEEAKRAGATPEQAQRIRSDRLGNTTNIREVTRDHWTLGALDALLQDLRYAFRFLRRSPGFTAVAVLSLALGIGANATVFTVADRMLFSAPAKVGNADALSMINIRRATETDTERPFHSAIMFHEFFGLLEQSQTIAAMALYMPPTRARLGRGPEAPRIKESLVTVNYFDVLGVRPERGRFFLADDDSTNRSEQAAVISHGFWKRHFGGADSALGARMRLGTADLVVIGIAPREFTGLELDAADIWRPIGAAAPARIGTDWKTWEGFGSRAFVQLKPGVNAETAAAEATVILRRLPAPKRRGPVQLTVSYGSVIQARGPSEQSNEVKVSTKLVVASGIVLLAACANLANLLLVRALNRRREIALRLAIGISRSRLVLQMFLESLLIAVSGALAALLATRWGGQALRTLVFPEMQWGSGTMNVRVFTFAVITGTVVAIIATIAPAIRMTRSDVATALRSAASQLTTSTGRLRQALLALQVAMSVVLIVGAAAFSKSLSHAYEFDMGVDVDRVVTMRFFVDADSLTANDRLTTLEEAARRIRLVQGVERATIASQLPLAGNSVMGFTIPERELPPRTFTLAWQVTPELQRTLGFKLVRGRWLRPEDVAAGTRGAILIGETGAQRLWPGMDPIGRCVRFGKEPAPCSEVIGVIGDLRQRSFREEAAIAMLIGKDKPEIDGATSAYVVVRTNGSAPAASFVAPIRRTLLDLRNDLATLEVRPLSQALDYDYRPLKLGKAAFGSFALLALMLASIGLYGILAFSVAQRTGEFGIRSALGAQARDLVVNVVAEGAAIVAVGLLIGAALSWYASTAIAALLFQSSARDAAPYIQAAIILGIVALAASAIPA